MKKLVTALLVIISFGIAFISAQEEPILPSQINAIRALAHRHGFNAEMLDRYLIQEYNAPLKDLKKQDGIALIELFQGPNPPKPSHIRSQVPTTRVVKKTKPATEQEISRKPFIAEILEVGMSKRFHLVDGNLIQGEIVKIEDGVCHIETIDGLLYVPRVDILKETARITKRDDTRYIGPILKETPEEVVLRSKYGDVVISKRDVKEMDRYHGGKLVPWAEEKKTFFRGKASLINIFMDPTAFPLEPHTFYVSGLSIGYGFTERFMVTSKFGSSFTGDLNIQPLLRFYHRQTGTSRRAAALGMQLFSHHPMETVVAKYAKYVENIDEGVSITDIDTATAANVLDEDAKKDFYWEFYGVLSSRRALPTRRGEVGWHLGFRTNSLCLQQPKLLSGYKWELPFPFRIWAAFEYDLTKNLKFAGLIWVDNGYKWRSVKMVFDDYLVDTMFLLDSKEGDYRMVDFDFGFLYALTETFRIGIHFQEPYLDFYWEFFEL